MSVVEGSRQPTLEGRGHPALLEQILDLEKAVAGMRERVEELENMHLRPPEPVGEKPVIGRYNR